MKPELFLGVVGAVGTNLNQVCESLKAALSLVGYRTSTIRLSDEIRALPPYQRLPTEPVETYYEAHMAAGDELCVKTHMPDAVASLAVLAIRRTRAELAGGDAETPLDATAYIIRSLKRPEEIQLLRRVYGDRCIVVSAYSPRGTRVDYLASRIAESHSAPRVEEYRSQSEHLIQIDEAESTSEVDFGQNVRDTFPLADVFIDASRPDYAERDVTRSIEILFGHPFKTPRADEYGMFLAHGAARRSADMGRQVGAAVLDTNGNVIAVGTNDVPKSGGGVYWEGDLNDRRDFVLGYDTSYRRRSQMLRDVLSKLREGGWLAANIKRKNLDSLVEDALRGDQPILREAQLMDVIEFGRSVHAEMLAITDAASRGVSVRGGTLYSTTFPCHNCARHIVSAGLNRCVYVEPYPKSLAEQLFPDSLVVDPTSPDLTRVNFVPYVGVGPRIYLEAFTSSQRKTPEGNVIRWDPASSIPKLVKESGTYPAAETTAVKNIGTALAEAKILKEGK